MCRATACAGGNAGFPYFSIYMLYIIYVYIIGVHLPQLRESGVDDGAVVGCSAGYASAQCDGVGICACRIRQALLLTGRSCAAGSNAVQQVGYL